MRIAFLALFDVFPLYSLLVKYMWISLSLIASVAACTSDIDSMVVGTSGGRGTVQTGSVGGALGGAVGGAVVGGGAFWLYQAGCPYDQYCIAAY